MKVQTQYFSRLVVLHVIFIVFVLFITGYGVSSDGKIIFVNASTCDLNYMPANPPIVFDVSLPPNGIK